MLMQPMAFFKHMHYTDKQIVMTHLSRSGCEKYSTTSEATCQA